MEAGLCPSLRRDDGAFYTIQPIAEFLVLPEWVSSRLRELLPCLWLRDAAPDKNASASPEVHTKNAFGIPISCEAEPERRFLKRALTGWVIPRLPLSRAIRPSGRACSRLADECCRPPCVRRRFASGSPL